MMRPYVIGLAAALTAGSAPALAQVAPPAAAISQAVFDRREARGIRFEGATFHIKVPQISQSNVDGRAQTHVSGQFSHTLRARPDDQYYYRFIIRDGVIVSYTESINRGGFSSVLRHVPVAGQVVGGVQAAGRSAADVVNGLARLAGFGVRLGTGWEGSARRLAAAVAVRIANGR